MDAAVKRDIWRVNLAGMLGSLYMQLTVGAIPLLFITKCLRIPKTEWALAASFIPLTSALHLVSALATERLRRRKLLSLTCFAVARLSTPAIAILPFLRGVTDTNVRVLYLAVALVAQGACNAFGTNAWMSWVADIVPEKHRGRFYSIRLALNTLAAVLVLLAAGRAIDYFGKADPTGYMLVFGFAFLVGELDLLIHAGVADRPMPKPTERPRWLPLVVAPWKHAGFRNLMLYRATLVFANGLVGLFAIMYLEEELGLSATQLLGLNAVLLLVQAPAFFMWRAIGERVGYRTVARMTCTLSGVGILYWWFLPQGNVAVFLTVLVLARVYYGLVAAGSMLANSTLNMNVAPDRHRSTYFAQVTTIVAVASALGIFCGRWIFVYVDPRTGGDFLGTKLTAVHVLIALLGLVRLLAVNLFSRGIPDARAEGVMPRIGRTLRTNVWRIFPTLLPLERPLSVEQRERHIRSMTELIPAPKEAELEESLKTVLKDPIHAEEEFHGILRRVRTRRAKDVEQMLGEITGSPARISAKRARAAANRIQRLFGEGELMACLRAVRRLAHQTADQWGSPLAGPSLSVIDRLTEPDDAEPPPERRTPDEADRPAGPSARPAPAIREESVLLALYACRQIVQGQERAARVKSIERMVTQIAESAAVHTSPSEAHAAVAEINRLYGEGNLGPCLSAVHRLAHRTADQWDSPMAGSALPVIDALAETVSRGHEPREDAVLLALYAYLQIVREPEEVNGKARERPPAPHSP